MKRQRKSNKTPKKLGKAMKEAFRQGAYLKWDEHTITVTSNSSEALGISSLVRKVLSLTAQEGEGEEPIGQKLEGYQDILEGLKKLGEQSGRSFYGRILNVVGLQTPIQRRLALAQQMVEQLILTLKGKLRVRYSFVEGLGHERSRFQKLPEAERELYWKYAYLSLLYPEAFTPTFEHLLQTGYAVAIGSFQRTLSHLIKEDETDAKLFTTYEKRILTLLSAHLRWIARVDDKLVHSVDDYQALLGALEESEHRLSRAGHTSRERTTLAKERITYHSLLERVDFASRALDVAVGQLANHIQHHARDRLGVLFLSGCRDTPIACYLHEQADGRYVFRIFSVHPVTPHHKHPFDKERRQIYASWSDLDQTILINPAFLRELLVNRQRNACSLDPDGISKLYQEVNTYLGKDMSPPSVVSTDYERSGTSALFAWLKHTLSESLFLKLMRILKNHGRQLHSSSQIKDMLSDLETAFLDCLYRAIGKSK